MRNSSIRTRQVSSSGAQAQRHGQKQGQVQDVCKATTRVTWI